MFISLTINYKRKNMRRGIPNDNYDYYDEDVARSSKAFLTFLAVTGLFLFIISIM